MEQITRKASPSLLPATSTPDSNSPFSDSEPHDQARTRAKHSFAGGSDLLHTHISAIV